ncbi:hypothetical protein E4H12_03215 [Candidatus Thorarchaeota archaeon]|nr:MAG: hypothetical protein E4H12_03215 [Candidatus Thorarchaeota archaeon]
MIRNDSSEQKVGEMKRYLPPGLLFVIFPALLSLLGVFILSQLPWLIGAYNYLRGASSPIDQSALALLGSDLARIAVLISGIVGMVIGLYLSRFPTAKIDVARREGEARISVRMFLALLLLWEIFVIPNIAIGLLDSFFNGFLTSHFLSDLCWFMAAGYFLAYSIPVLIKYGFLVMHARSIDSKIELIELRSGNGFIKRFQCLILRVIYDGPDP